MKVSFTTRYGLRVGYEIVRGALQHIPDIESDTFDILCEAEQEIRKELFFAVRDSQAAFDTLLHQLSRGDSAGLKEVDRVTCNLVE